MVEWMKSLLGENVPPAVSVILLFAAVIVLIFILLWIARRILGGTFIAGGRARQLRLAVMDATPVDSKRRLVLVRRDDVEHLILIGGPTDVVVEQNIRISTSTQRQTTVQPETEAAVAFPDHKPIDQPRPVAPAPPVQMAPKPEPIPAYRPNPIPAPVPPYVAPPRPMQPAPAPIRPVAPAAVASPLPPRPVTPLAPSVATNTPRVMGTVTPLATPTAASAPALATPAPRVEPAVAREPQSEPAKMAMVDPDDSLLTDLSDEISRVGESEAAEISLEDEMESLLANLDTKGERQV